MWRYLTIMNLFTSILGWQLLKTFSGGLWQKPVLVNGVAVLHLHSQSICFCIVFLSVCIVFSSLSLTAHCASFLFHPLQSDAFDTDLQIQSWLWYTHIKHTRGLSLLCTANDGKMVMLGIGYLVGCERPSKAPWISALLYCGSLW